MRCGPWTSPPGGPRPRRQDENHHFIERRQQDVIERILRHCGLWEGSIRTLANSRAPPAGSRRGSIAAGELELVADPEFLESLTA